MNTYYFIQTHFWTSSISVQQYLVNSPINLHWNNEVCIADGLQEDSKQRKCSKLVVFSLKIAQSDKEAAKPHACIFG